MLSLFTVQLSHPYMTTEKTINLTIQIFVGKVIFLLFYMMLRFVIAFLPRSKHLLISWLQSLSTVILDPKKIVSHCFHCSPSISYEEMGPNAMILVFWMLDFKPDFHSPLSPSSRKFLFTFCHMGGVICISEFIDISPSTLDSSLCFIQPSISHDVLCI